MVEDLYTAFYDELVYYCASLSHDPTAAEDLVQETYMRALNHVDDLQDLSRSQCRSWLYQTAKHLYIDRVRKLAREVCVEQEQLELSTFEEDLTKIAVRQLVSRLPESEQALFTLRYFEGYNATELGDLFDLPPSTVRARLASARKHLMAYYQEEMNVFC